MTVNKTKSFSAMVGAPNGVALAASVETSPLDRERAARYVAAHAADADNARELLAALGLITLSKPRPGRHRRTKEPPAQPDVLTAKARAEAESIES
ncbi:hypothetical protein AB0N06_28180 [Streptomyces sp. NPDC051020]|uniref:hypothetical protein n=1 Tax=Streptomyces sp. NPDC051020 TaxID=3155409 RepID=UPI00343EFC61